jgi:hypothetical protein
MQTKAQVETGSSSARRDENLKCWNAGSNPLCLRIELADGTQFMLPYGYFEGVRFVREAETEILRIQFKANQFTIRGNALGELFSAFQTLSVEWMKECPRRYQALAQKVQGFIEKIEELRIEE